MKLRAPLMMKRLLLASAVLVALGGTARALPPGNAVTICDTVVTTRCLTVNADGSINVSGGGGGGGAITAPLGPTTADAAAVAVVPSATATWTIANASFGISGTLPTFAATPTFDLGALNGAATAANQSTANASLATLHTDLTTLNTTASGSIPAGAAIIGALSANQSVNVAQVNGSTTPVGAGVASTAGTQRHVVAQDTTTIAGSAPGTAGSASAQVVTVQGITSGTNLNTAVASCSACNANGAAVIASSTPVGLPSDQFGLSTDAASTVTNGSAATAIAIFKEISALEQAPVSRAVTNVGTFAVQVAATTSGGASVYHKIATASDNHVVIKNGAGTVYGIDATAAGTGVQYVRLYDAGTGFNGCNSATGLLWGQQVPAAAAAAGVGGGYAIPIPAVGIAFSTGLSICITGAVSDTDTTNAATTTLANVLYK